MVLEVTFLQLLVMRIKSTYKSNPNNKQLLFWSIQEYYKNIP